MGDLDIEAAVLIVKGQTNEAITLYRDYEGPMAEESKQYRREKIAELTLPD